MNIPIRIGLTLVLLNVVAFFVVTGFGIALSKAGNPKWDRAVKWLAISAISELLLGLFGGIAYVIWNAA